MIARELISELKIPVQPDNTAEQVLTMMQLYHVRHLPVVSNDILLGVISEEDVTSVLPEKTVRNIIINNSYAHVRSYDHIFEVMARMADNDLTLIPVLGEEDTFEGIITQEDVLQFYAKSFSFREPGSILVLETTRRSYSLSEIARVLELENAAILACFINNQMDSEILLVTLKVNRREVSQLVSALERYDYKISATFAEEEYYDDLKDRYDQLMNYLNV